MLTFRVLNMRNNQGWGVLNLLVVAWEMLTRPSHARGAARTRQRITIVVLLACSQAGSTSSDAESEQLVERWDGPTRKLPQQLPQISWSCFAHREKSLTIMTLELQPSAASSSPTPKSNICPCKVGLLWCGLGCRSLNSGGLLKLLQKQPWERSAAMAAETVKYLQQLKITVELHHSGRPRIIHSSALETNIKWGWIVNG